MSLYIIDYENVNESGLEGIKSLKSEDQVHIFYSDHIKYIPFNRSIEMTQSKARIEFIETHKTGKNYLDFQLSTYLGYLIGRGEKTSVYVISKDTGFDSIVDFWKGRNISIVRQDCIAGNSSASASGNNTSSNNTGNNGNSSSNGNKKNSRKQNNRNITLVSEGIPGTSDHLDLPGNQNIDISSKTSKESYSESTSESSLVPSSESDIQISSDSQTISQIESEKHLVTEETEKKEPKPAKPVKQKKAAQKKCDLPEAFRKKVRIAVKNERLSPISYTVIYKTIEESQEKFEFHNSLVKSFESEKGQTIYGLVKDIFEEYKQTKNSSEHH